MVINDPEQIIKREKLIISSLSIENSYCKSCTLEAIQYHKDIIYWMEVILGREEL